MGKAKPLGAGGPLGKCCWNDVFDLRFVYRMEGLDVLIELDAVKEDSLAIWTLGMDARFCLKGI